ncbi:MAG TPA: signal peptidase I [Candidatus Baltobacteraceae bacterium]
MKLTLQAAALALIAFALMLRTPQVSGLSMEPHIDSGEYVVINTLAYRFESPQRTEIVAFRHERTAPEVFIKRIIGVPGDTIRIDHGAVYRNGAPLDEPYVRFRDNRSEATLTVPADGYYVLGDNRANSEDSRTWGFVKSGDIIGRAMFGLWPLDRVGSL